MATCTHVHVCIIAVCGIISWTNENDVVAKMI